MYAVYSYEQVPLPSLYFSHGKVFQRDGVLLADTPHINRRPEEEVFRLRLGVERSEIPPVQVFGSPMLNP